MKTTRLLLLAITLSTLMSPYLGAQSNIRSQLWNDPTFVNEFIGSYGFLAGYEPPVSNEERELLRGLIEQIKASPQAAIQSLETRTTSSGSAAFDFILGNLHFQEGNLNRAKRAYRNAIRKHPDFRRAHKNLGLVLVQQGNFEDAVRAISKALELGEVDGRSYGLLGYAYLSLDRNYPAEVAYRQAILMQPDVIDWQVGLARSLLQTERYTEAIALFDTLLLDAPDRADYWLAQTNAFLGKRDSMAAAKNIEVVHRMGAADLNSLTLLGDIYMNHESPDLALRAYLAAIEIAGPENIQPLLRAASLLTRSGHYTQAKAMIPKIREQVELTREATLSLLTLEARIARADGDDETAVELLQEIVARDALNGDALIQLANYHAEQGDMARAITRFEQAQKIAASERDALIAHAQARVRNGQLREALPLLRRALQLQPDNNLEDYTQRVERAARSQG